jgi:serine protease Do
MRSTLTLVAGLCFSLSLMAQTSFEPLKITLVTHPVAEVSDGVEASVTIKRDGGGHGSGFAISNDGYILTTFHVVQSEKDSTATVGITVIMPDGSIVPGTVIRHCDSMNVALIKVEKSFNKAFQLNNTKQFKLLDEIYAIGTPKSIELGQSASHGMISGERIIKNKPLLQLNISINKGNSGGPVFGTTGLLHGMVVSKMTGYATEGIGFAVPAYKIQEYLKISY